METGLRMDSKPKAFVVHGHNELARLELCEMLASEFELEPVVLKQQAGVGRTIIENFEHHAAQCDVAIVLLSGDDVSVSGGQQSSRSRQNVIFELGFFCGSLGRDRVCLIYESGVELPSDLHGVIYYPYRATVREVYPHLSKHLIELGLLTGIGSDEVILIVDDDLTAASELFKQIEVSLKGHGKVRLVSDPKKACSLVARDRQIRGCITDIVFRGFSEIAGVEVVENAIRRGVRVAVITGHKKQNIGVATAELKRLGLDDTAILRKPVTLREYRRFLHDLKDAITGPRG
jgi:hypothetical protein